MEPAIAESKQLNQTPVRPLSVLVSDDEVVIVTNAGNNHKSLLVQVGQTFNLTKAVKHAYQKDKLYYKVLKKPRAHALFGCKDDLIFTKNLLKWDVLCVPCNAFYNRRQVIEIIMNHTHTIIGQNCTIHQKIFLVDIYGTRHRGVLHIMQCMCCS